MNAWTKSRTKRTGGKRVIVIGYRLAVALLLAVAVGLIAPVPTAQAATIIVDSTLDNVIAGDGACTLREAINTANASSDTTAGDCAAGSGPDEF